MAKRRRVVSIADLLKGRQREPDEALTLLRKHLKAAAGGRYHTTGNYFAEILDRNEKNAQIIAEIKDVQWRITNYCILLYVAVAGAVQLTKGMSRDWLYYLVSALIAVVSIGLVYYVARRMMDKTVGDLAFYREHSRVNEEMLNMTTGLQQLANELVSRRRPDMRNKHDFSYSADQNSTVFTEWLRRIMIGAGIVALAVTQVLIWAPMISTH